MTGDWLIAAAATLFAWSACTVQVAEKYAPDVQDPFADKQITCEEMKRYPDRVFTDEIDLGSGHGSPLDVDYSCKESLTSLPFIERLNSLTEQIRSEEGPHCTGSIIHAHWRYHAFKLLEAAFAPRIMLEHAEQRAKRFDRDHYPQIRDTNVLEYLERWSYGGIHNFELHRAYRAEIERTRPLLASHYGATFGYSAAESEQLATRAVMLFVSRAGGSFGRDLLPETKSILRTAEIVQLPHGDMIAALENANLEDRRKALNIALLLDRPTEYVAYLAERADGLDHGDEPPLFHALRNKGHVTLLLDRGADVNYQNGFGKTALFYAIGFNDLELVKLLIAWGADVNHRYLKSVNSGEFACTYNIAHTERSTLMHAAQHADVAMLRLLADAAVKLQHTDGSGYTATDYAIEGARNENADYLKSLGVKSLVVEPQKRASECHKQATDNQLKGEAWIDFVRDCTGTR